MKIFGYQTTSDLSFGQNVPHLNGEVGMFVQKNNECLFLLIRFFENLT